MCLRKEPLETGDYREHPMQPEWRNVHGIAQGRQRYRKYPDPKRRKLPGKALLNYSLFTTNLNRKQVTSAFMLKTYPGGAAPGYVKNVILRNFTNTDVTCKHERFFVLSCAYARR